MILLYQLKRIHFASCVLILSDTPKSRFNEARFNESHDLVNKCQTFLLIPSLDLVKFHDLTNKSSLTRSFVKLRFGCTLIIFSHYYCMKGILNSPKTIVSEWKSKSHFPISFEKGLHLRYLT